MSSIPDYTLEAYVLWNHDLVVEGHDDANSSLRIAEALGMPPHRLRLTAPEFKILMQLYEPIRDPVERYLNEFDEEEHGSWRDFSTVVHDCVPEVISDAACTYLDGIRDARTRQGLLLKELRQLLRYASWQLSEGTDYHPNLPEAAESARHVVTAVVKDAETTKAVMKNLDEMIKAKQIALIDEAAQIVLDNGMSNTGAVHPSSRYDADAILELKKTL